MITEDKITALFCMADDFCLFLWMIEIPDIKWAEKHDSETIYIR